MVPPNAAGLTPLVASCFVFVAIVSLFFRILQSLQYGLEWNGLEWNHGVEWSGMDFSGV